MITSSKKRNKSKYWIGRGPKDTTNWIYYGPNPPIIKDGSISAYADIIDEWPRLVGSIDNFNIPIGEIRPLVLYTK